MMAKQQQIIYDINLSLMTFLIILHTCIQQYSILNLIYIRLDGCFAINDLDLFVAV